jgi:hypothetical protein
VEALGPSLCNKVDPYQSAQRLFEVLLDVELKPHSEHYSLSNFDIVGLKRQLVVPVDNMERARGYPRNDQLKAWPIYKSLRIFGYCN